MESIIASYSDPDKFHRIYFMHLEKDRLKSFKDWPFSDCNCTAEKMAAAGFYHCPTDHEPDAAKCFMCLKELDGWEPTDNPWEEHKSHSSACLYLTLKSPIEKMTVEDVLKQEMTRVKRLVAKIYDEKINEFNVNCTETRKQMEQML